MASCCSEGQRTCLVGIHTTATKLCMVPAKKQEREWLGLMLWAVHTCLLLLATLPHIGRACNMPNLLMYSCCKLSLQRSLIRLIDLHFENRSKVAMISSMQEALVLLIACC